MNPRGDATSYAWASCGASTRSGRPPMDRDDGESLREKITGKHNCLSVIFLCALWLAAGALKFAHEAG
jgi:hypothetical protein